MTPEEIEAARLAEEARLEAEKANDPLLQLQEKLAKAEADRDNYKNVALTRLGKLPGDADFIDNSNESKLSVAEQVRLALLDREVETVRKAEKEEIERIRKENAELRLAVKNRPGSSSIGGGSDSSLEPKDNVFSATQIEALRAKAIRIKMDPEKYIQSAKENLSRRS